MELMDAQDMALQLMLKHELINRGWTFGYMKNLTNGHMRTAGYCDHQWQAVKLAPQLVRRASDAKIKDTILHEIAHALVECDGHEETEHHGQAWMAQCRKLGCKPHRNGLNDWPRQMQRGTS